MTITVRGQGKYELLHGCGGTTASDFGVLADSNLDVRGWRSVAYTLTAACRGADWRVMADNASDFGAEVIVQASATVASAATGSYSITNAPYLYYRVNVRSTAAASPSEVSLYAIMTG
jgi:hypothetical protein